MIPGPAESAPTVADIPTVTAAVDGIRLPEGVKLPDGTRWEGRHVRLERFEGPLDLLLFLVREKKVPVSEVNISQITDEFLKFVATLQFDLTENPAFLDEAGDFLVMAATLLQIKMRELLPREEAESADEEMTREELERLLREYEAFKAAARGLEDKKHERERIFIRSEPIVAPMQEELLKVDLTKLLEAFNNVLKRAPDERIREIARAPITIDECIRRVRERLQTQRMILFEELFEGVRTKSVLIALFLALLELLKSNEITVSQSDPFGPIRIMANENRANEENTRAPELSEDAEGESAESLPRPQGDSAPEM